jgi:hypothetical protein
VGADIQGGALALTFSLEDYQTSEIWSPARPRDFVAQVDVLPLADGAGGGLIFGRADWDNYFTVEVASDGTFGVRRLSGGEWAEPPIERRAHEAILRGSEVNRLLVIREGNAVHIYVNSVLVGAAEGLDDLQGEVGLRAFSGTAVPAEVRLDNFHLWALRSTP